MRIEGDAHNEGIDLQSCAVLVRNARARHAKAPCYFLSDDTQTPYLAAKFVGAS
jgi:hypothetical protein